MRIIDADALRAEYQAIIDRGDMFCEYDIIGMLDNAPTIDPQIELIVARSQGYECGFAEGYEEGFAKGKERPTGHWIIEECSLGKTYYCSECYAHPEVCFDFCPYCGADMRKGGKQ